MLSGATLSVILPVYNEAATIEAVVRDIHAKVAKEIPGYSFIIAEDGSTDGTQEILARLKTEIPFTLISGARRKGYTQAFKDALALARTEWIFFSDSDGQHDPDDLSLLLAQAGSYDVVSGCKISRKDPWYRLLLSAGYNILIKMFFGLPMKDINSGFKLIRREVVQEILPQVTTMRQCVMSEFILRAYLAGYKITEVSVSHFPREKGTTAIFHPGKLPGIVWGLLHALFTLRAEYRRKGVL